MKPLQQWAVLSCLGLIITGCSSSQPNQGHGGLAEGYQQIELQNSNFSPTMPDEPLGPEHGLRFDWQLTKLHLDSLIREGANWCFPAAVLQAQTKQNRIARELQGGLLLDAANDIVIQRQRLHQLEQQLDYVLSQTQCQPSQNEHGQQSDQMQLITELYNLLNVDNQFAKNSAEINPKYMGKLAHAAHIIREYPQLSLIITGHADATGSFKYNEQLATKRAEQVKRYLSIFGIPSQDLQTKSMGEELPLHPGDSAAIKLTNRRVSIEVITKQSPIDESLSKTSTQSLVPESYSPNSQLAK